MTIELQIEGLVGPTHNYAGLGLGNVASAIHANRRANPQAAALQSLEKMHWLHQQGVPVMVMPPQTRPRLDVLKTLGFAGSVAEQLHAIAEAAPSSFRAIWSASSMWTANAATVTPSCDAADGGLHVTPANLLSSLHRVLEARETQHFLQQLLGDIPSLQLHPALPVTTRLADEGAANHMRLCGANETELLHLFTYGAYPPDSQFPARHMPRQMRAASADVAQLHQLPHASVRLIQQHPDAIDAGVFHHDVIGMSHLDLLIVHAQAWMDQPRLLEALRRDAPWLTIREISTTELSLGEAVATYFFNAQLVSIPEHGKTEILFPQECAEHPRARALAESLAEELDTIEAVHFFDLRESMQNGGGPACLRLRVPLMPNELSALHSSRLFSTRQYHQLTQFVRARYRDRLEPDDLRDAAFAAEALACQRDLLALLGLRPWQPHD